MAHNNYVRSATLGVWNNGDVPTGAEFTYLDQTLFKAINGDDGGVWAPALSPIYVGGLGMEVQGPFQALDSNIAISSGKFLTISSGGQLYVFAGGTCSFNGTSTVSSSFTFSSGALIVMLNGSTINMQGGSTLTMAGTANVTGTFNMNGTASFGGTTTFTGGTTFNGLVTWGASNSMSGTMHVSSGAAIAVAGNITWSSTGSWTMQFGSQGTIQSGATVTGNAGSTIAVYGSLNVESGGVETIKSGGQLVQQGLLTKSGSGGITHFRESVLTDADATINPWTADTWVAPAMTADRIVKLANYTGGGCFEFTIQSFSYPSLFKIFIRRENNTDIVSFNLSGGLRENKSVTIYWSLALGRYELKNISSPLVTP